MPRFFVDALPKEGSTFRLTGENADHVRVLRLKPGESVTLCDGRGMECDCTVTGDGMDLLPGPAVLSVTEPRLRVTLFVAFPKADKLEHVIQKAVELGAAEIVVFPSRYCVSRPDAKALDKKLDRWRKIARSAAEQSRRGTVPVVTALPSFEAAAQAAARYELPILFYENEHSRTLRQTLPEALTTAALMTGPEGGFDPAEVARAEAAGWKVCTLGPRILRCETAPLAGLTALMYATGEI